MWPFPRRPSSRTAGSGGPDPLPRLVAALPTLREHLDLQPTANAGICLRPGKAKRRKGDALLSQVEVDAAAGEALLWGTEISGTSFKTAQDRYGYLWVVLKNSADFDGLVSATGKVAAMVSEKGRRDHLVVALFPFRQGQREVFWVYSFTRQRFYPFAPLEEPRRDGELELSMASTLEKALPIEPQLERWYALWGLPFDGA